MVHGIGTIPGIIVVIISIVVMDHSCITMITITTMVMVIIMMIHAYRHNRKCSKIRRIITVIIRRRIGDIGR
jgi:FtsH-binding integral membrane protein